MSARAEICHVIGPLRLFYNQQHVHDTIFAGAIFNSLETIHFAVA